MSGASRVWVAGLVALCGLGCGSRAVVGTVPEGEAGRVAPESSGPSAGAEGSGSGREGDAAGGPVKLEAPAVKAPEGLEVKLDGNLVALVRSYRQGGEAAVKTLVRSGNVEMIGNRLRLGVTVADEAQVAAVKRKIGELGGEVTVELGNRVFALLPVAALEPLAAEEGVWSMEAPQPVASPLEPK